MNKKKPRNNCLNCGKECVEVKSVYCSNVCHTDFKYKEYIRKWKAGEVNGITGKYATSNHIRRYLFEKYDNKCSECGWFKMNITSGKILLNIEHTDGDFSNNKEDNLKLLCPCCHSLIPTYGALNRGNGRKERRKYDKYLYETVDTKTY